MSNTYESFISSIFHLISTGCSLSQVTEISESKTADAGELLYLSSINLYDYMSSHVEEQ